MIWIEQMATSQTEIESHVVELATEAFKVFCDDIAGMFGIGMECEQREVRTETVAGLKKCFKKLVAVNVVDATGVLKGTFGLIFDQEGLFTLGGVIVMLPEQRILANRKDPSPQLAASMVDAVGEAGNLLVGSWDRVFREGLKGHGHFLQRLPAFVGKPWDEPEKNIGLASDGQFVYVQYEMSIGSFPPFNCGAVFPQTLLTGNSELPQSRQGSLLPGESDSEPASSEDAAPEAETPQDATTSPEKTSPAESDKPQGHDSGEPRQKLPSAAEEARAGEEAVVQENTPETQGAAPVSAEVSRGDSEDTAEDKTEAEQPRTAQESPRKKSRPRRRAAKKASEKAGTPDTQTAPSASGEASRGDGERAVGAQADSQQTGEAQRRDGQAPEPEQPAAIVNSEPAELTTGKVSEAIRKLTQSSGLPGVESPGLPGEPLRPVISQSPAGHASGGLWSICAKDIMQGRVVWASPDETVQQALAKMQQHDTGCLIIGRDETLEGIVSRSDIAGALSPYLRPLFAKWRRPLDDATLQIRLKWIMSRPVRTVGLDTPLAVIMENACRFGGRALPVVDEQGKVQGLVTVFEVFGMLLKTYAGVCTVGRAPQSPPLT